MVILHYALRFSAEMKYFYIRYFTVMKYYGHKWAASDIYFWKTVKVTNIMCKIDLRFWKELERSWFLTINEAREFFTAYKQPKRTL